MPLLLHFFSTYHPPTHTTHNKTHLQLTSKSLPPSPLPPEKSHPKPLTLFTSKASNNDSSKDEDVHVPDYEALARNIQNRASRHVGTATLEVRHFHEFFGTRVLVVKKIRDLLKRDSPSPPRRAAQSICFGPSIL